MVGVKLIHQPHQTQPVREGGPVSSRSDEEARIMNPGVADRSFFKNLIPLSSPKQPDLRSWSYRIALLPEDRKPPSFRSIPAWNLIPSPVRFSAALIGLCAIILSTASLAVPGRLREGGMEGLEEV